MKIPRISEILGWILIVAGVFLLGMVILRSVEPYFPTQLKTPPWSKQSKSKPRPKPRPKPPKPNLKQVSNTKEYLRKINTQLVEGFASIDSASYSGSYNSWQGKVQSWWEYSNKEEQEVVWHSAKCPGKKSTTLVFSGVLGIGAGEAQLYVNDKAALRLNTGTGPETEEWKSGDFRLKFFAMVVHSNKERWGVFCLTIPEEEVTMGKSVKLKVTSYQPPGIGGSYFMLSEVPDTLKKLGMK